MRFDEKPVFIRYSLVAVAILYVAVYLHLTNSAGLSDDQPPWHQNFDQIWYWRSAAAFAHGSLATTEHWYPPLYSLLIAPLVWAGETHAQLIVGLGLYLASFAAFSAIARHFAMRPVLAAVFFVIATLWFDGMSRAWIWPWSTSLSGALILVAIAATLGLYFGGDGRETPDLAGPDARRLGGTVSHRQLAFLGAVLAAIPCARPVDGVVTAILGLFAAWQLLLVWRDWRGFGALTAGGLAILLPYAALYLAIWGPAASEYARMSAAIGFDFGKLGWKAYVLLVEPEPWYPSSVAMLDRMPWLILTGAALLAGLGRRETRLRIAIVALPTLAYFLPMICYRGFMPSSLWLFGLVHYFKWVVLLATLIAWDFVVRLRSAPALYAACLAAVLALSAISFRPVAAGPDAPARLLVYSVRLPVSENAIYMGETALHDRAGSQRNLFDMQAVLAPEGVIKVIAQSRDFSGDERITADVPDADTIRAAAAVRVDGAKSAAAFGPLIGRYKPQMEFGLPCWLPVYTCPQRLLPPVPLT